MSEQRKLMYLTSHKIASRSCNRCRMLFPTGSATKLELVVCTGLSTTRRSVQERNNDNESFGARILSTVVALDQKACCWVGTKRHSCLIPACILWMRKRHLRRGETGMALSYRRTVQFLSLVLLMIADRGVSIDLDRQLRVLKTGNGLQKREAFSNSEQTTQMSSIHRHRQTYHKTGSNPPYKPPGNNQKGEKYPSDDYEDFYMYDKYAKKYHYLYWDNQQFSGKISSEKPSPAPQRKLTPEPAPRPTPLPTDRPTRTPSARPTYSPVKPELTNPPSASPIRAPSLSPTEPPTDRPTTVRPTEIPIFPATDSPVYRPTASPTMAPTTREPTSKPTAPPTDVPIQSPTGGPTVTPVMPTNRPSGSPTSLPTPVNMESPSISPISPTVAPNELPTPLPSLMPIAVPTVRPTRVETQSPTDRPTYLPSNLPTRAPIAVPTQAPGPGPTTPSPTLEPQSPTLVPISSPTLVPTKLQTPLPTPAPTPVPAQAPTTVPTGLQTPVPTQAPTPVPIEVPTPVPTGSKTPVPTQAPTPVPTGLQTPLPTEAPTPMPTGLQTPLPTQAPTPAPTGLQTPVPTQAPTPVPTGLQTPVPTQAPTPVPTQPPTPVPTASQTPVPTQAPTPSGLEPTLPPGPGTPSPSVSLTQPPTSCLADCEFISGSLGESGNEMVGRIRRDPDASTCENRKVFPGIFGNIPRFYEMIGPWCNEADEEVCATMIWSFDDCIEQGDVLVHPIAYSSFDPDNPGEGYLGDSGRSENSVFSFNVPAKSEIYFIGQQVFPGPDGLGCTFQVRVDFDDCLDTGQSVQFFEGLNENRIFTNSYDVSNTEIALPPSLTSVVEPQSQSAGVSQDEPRARGQDPSYSQPRARDSEYEQQDPSQHYVRAQSIPSQNSRRPMSKVALPQDVSQQDRYRRQGPRGLRLSLSDS